MFIKLLTKTLPLIYYKPPRCKVSFKNCYLIISLKQLDVCVPNSATRKIVTGLSCRNLQTTVRKGILNTYECVFTMQVISLEQTLLGSRM